MTPGRALIWLIFSSASTTAAAASCSHDWDRYDPRLGTASASSSGGGAAQSVAASSSSATSSTSSGAGGGNAGPPTYREIILADGPLAYWRFGETHGPVIVDELAQHSGSASITGLTYGVPGVIADDTAISFDGLSGYIGVPGGWDFIDQSPYSFEVWIKLGPSTSGYPRVLSKELNASPRQGYLFLAGAPVDGGSQFFGTERWVDDQNILASFFNGAVSATQWTHVVVRFDGAVGDIFVNGALVGSAGSMGNAGITATAGQFTIGAGSAKDSNFSGSLDELAVYGKALTNDVITRHFKAGSSGL